MRMAGLAAELAVLHAGENAAPCVQKAGESARRQTQVPEGTEPEKVLPRGVGILQAECRPLERLRSPPATQGTHRPDSYWTNTKSQPVWAVAKSIGHYPLHGLGQMGNL